MGCGSSNVVAPELAPSKPPPESQDLSSSSISLTGSRQSVKIRQRKARSSDALQSGSTASLSSEIEQDAQASEVTSISSRNISGKSKASASSGDSGLGEEYKEIITDKSDETLRENASIPGELEKPSLSIDGSGVNNDRGRSKSTGSNSSEKEQPLPNGIRHVKFAEKIIGELPDSPSILKRPVSRGGVAFDVVVGDNLSPQMPVFSSSTKRRKRLSYQELQEKQKLVVQRKKEREQMIVERLRAKEERDKQVRDALDKFAEMQTELTSIKQKKQEVTTENREAYLSSLRDKLREKSEHVDEVKTAKKAKKLVPLNKPPKPNAGRQDNPVNIRAN